MRPLPTFVIVVTLGLALAGLSQRLAVAPSAAFMLGVAYLMVASLLINTIAGASR